jgi:hypothetical protein
MTVARQEKIPPDAKSSLATRESGPGHGHLLQSQDGVEVVLNVLDTVAQ